MKNAIGRIRADCAGWQHELHEDLEDDEEETLEDEDFGTTNGKEISKKRTNK